MVRRRSGLDSGTTPRSPEGRRLLVELPTSRAKQYTAPCAVRHRRCEVLCSVQATAGQ
jgi:hypothetical protein